MSPEARDAYWNVVRECLTRFHGLSECEAVRRMREHVEDLRQAPEGLPMEIVYNVEPFDVACDLAEQELDWDLFKDEYLSMLSRHFPPVVPPPPPRRSPDLFPVF